MKSTLVLISFLLFSRAFAHCPIPVNTETGSYCMDLEWKQGDRKVKGALEASDILSPYLNKMGEVPQKWIYSRAIFRMWQEGDKNHVPVVIDGFRIFPYMLMVDGMHHIGTYSFEYSVADSAYVLAGFSLQEMPGCWSLRWTIQADDAADSSVLAANIGDYSNLSVDENLVSANYCMDSVAPMPNPTPTEHQHH